MTVKQIFLYSLFFLAALTLCLFFRFPGKEAAGILTRSLTKPDSNLSVSIDTIKPALPFHLEFEKTEFHLGQDVFLKPDSFAVLPGFFNFFKTEKTIDIRSDLQGGAVKAKVFLTSINPFVFTGTKGSVSGLRIDGFKYITPLGDMTLNGEMDGNFSFDITPEKTVKGDGMILFHKFTVEMKNSFFNTLNIPLVDFSDIQLDYTHQGNMLTIRQCTAKGSIIHVTVKGTIEIMSPVKESRLRLSGSLLPDSPYLAKFAHAQTVKAMTKDTAKEGIGFNITGTFKSPEIGL